jgi:uncharacterized protein (DUF1499 family)
MTSLPWHSKLVLALIALVPVYFMVAALGTKFGVWDYQIGLGLLVFTAGVWVLGIAALIALVALGLAVIAKPRRSLAMGIAAVGLVLPLGFVVWGLSVAAVAGANPIHDVATDTADPPEFSNATLAQREEVGANPLRDYQTPLGRMEPWKSSERVPEKVKIQSHAQFITSEYAGLAPLPLAGASRADAVSAIAAAMEEIGLGDIRKDLGAGRVEAVATSFWYGFKDDVVARIGPSQIDFRSVSRVGQSDLGTNAKRIAVLRKATAARIGQR